MRKIFKTFVLTTILVLFVFSVFALESTLTLRGGVSQAKTDITDNNKFNGMLGISYELWLAKWMSLGIYPYITRAEAGPAHHGWEFADVPSKVEEDTYTGNFQSPLVGGDLMLKLRPHWTKIAPYIMGGAGLVNYYPKYRNGDHIVYDEYAHVLNYNDNPEDDVAWEKTDYDYTVACVPTVGAGFDIFTKWDVDFELGGQVNFMNTDLLDGIEKGDDNDLFWMAYLGVSHTFGKTKKAEPVVIIPEPEPVVEEPVIVPELKVSPTSRNVAYQAGSTDFIIATNQNWTATENEDWLYVTPTSGTGNANFKVIYDENTSTEPRTGYIYVTAGNLKQTLTVIQAGTPKPALELKNVHFAFDKDKIADLESYETEKSILDANVAALKLYPDVRVELRGHADYIGGEDYNLRLSDRRALAVYNYLVNNGIDAGRLTQNGLGEDQPIATNDTDEGRALNRRVEFIIK